MNESLEATLKDLTENRWRWLSVANLPDTVKAKIIKWEFKTDRMGNECLFIHLETDKKEVIIQKFPRSTWMELYDRLKRVGFERAENEYLTWVKTTVGRAINPRLVPLIEKRK